MRKLAVILLVAGGPSGQASAQDGPGDLRLLNLATELIVAPQNGARTAACDVLRFTPDGNYLLATGDDKVVRVWPFSPKTGLDLDNTRELRWSAYREQRGSIFALALDARAQSVAVAGAGLRPGAVAILDRSGAVKHGVTAAATDRASQKVTTIWSLAFSPSGKQVAYGGIDGSVWAWQPGKGKPRRLGAHPLPQGSRVNHVRLVVFTAASEVLSLAADGSVCRWDTGRDNAAADIRFRFSASNIFGAAVDPGKRWLAAFGQGSGARRVELRSLDGRQVKLLPLPETKGLLNNPRCVAFDARSERLAVGYQSIPENAAFFKIVGGGVALYDLTRAEPQPSPGPSSTYYPEAVAFHPNGKVLAVAGGDDHQVVVWELGRPPTPFSRVVSPGHCLWGVGLSRDGNLLGFRDARTENPPEPNSWGRGPWQVFDLQARHFATPAQAQAFTPVKPLREGVLVPKRSLGTRSLGTSWSVVPDRKDAYVWRVRDGRGREYELPLTRNQDLMPRCYTFLDGNPVRLVVGHYWGLSVFELGAGKPRLLRKGVGHQGEVMAVAPSADGKLLVTAGRDQTVACWRLTDWDHQRELGAGFSIQDGRLIVDAVQTGSPAWEARLRKGDEVVLLAVNLKKVFDRYGSRQFGPALGRPQDCLAPLRDPVPGQQLYFGVRRAGVKGTVELQTTVRQRPLWRFFPTRDREWVLWRTHDFYYDTSTNGDFDIGWQLSGEVNTTPVFLKAEQLRSRFHRPAKVAQLLKDVTTAPDRVRLLDVQPPRVSAQVDRRQVKGADVKVVVAATGRPGMELSRVILWVNNHIVKEWSLDARVLREEVIVPNRVLRRGKNLVIAQAFNRAEDQRESRQDAPTVEVECTRAGGPPDLYTLAVGVGDYTRVKLHKRAELGDLSANKDAAAIGTVWTKRAGKLFHKTHAHVLTDAAATRPRILAEIERIGKNATPDDLLIFFLAGHGTSDDELRKVGVRFPKERAGEKNFVFCTHNFDLEDPRGTGLTGRDIYRALSRLPCRKLVLLDTCHSGTLEVDPVRAMAPSAVGPVVFSACEANQTAAEHGQLGLEFTQGRARGLFAIALILALEEEFDDVDRNKNKRLDVGELKSYLEKRVGELIRSVDSRVPQNPRGFLPADERNPYLEVAEK